MTQGAPERYLRAAGRVVRAVAARTRPPIGAAFVEEPAPGPIASGPIDVVAWVASRHPGPWTVVVTIDRDAAAVARIGRRRPDVVGAHPWAADAAEVRATVTPDPGWRRLGIALAAPGRPLVELTSVNVDVEPPVRMIGGIDAPADGADIAGGFAIVSGWAWSAFGPVASVDLVIGNELAGPARLGVVRGDVAVAIGRPAAVCAGFEALLDLRGCESGRPVVLSASASDMAGNRTALGSVTIVPVVAAPIDGPPPEPLPAPARAKRSRGRGALLVVTHDLSVGGAQRFVADMVGGFAPKASSVCVVAAADGAWRGPLETLGAEVHITGALRLDSAHTYEGAVAELRSWLQGRPVDAVLASTLDVFPVVDALARDRRAVVWALHEHLDPAAHLTMSSPGNRADPYIASRQQLALGAATTVFAADATRALYVGAGAVDPERAHVVPYGIEQPPSERPGGDGDGGFLLVCVGRFEPRKSQTRLIEAVSVLRHELSNLRLALVGAGDDELSRAARASVAAHDLGDVVQIVDVTSPSEWYAAADAVVLASDLESMPYALLEPMALGVPVLAAAVAGIPELITDGETGMLFEPRDLRALVAAIRRMHALDVDARKDMGLRGAEVVRTRHRLDTSVAALSALLEAPL